MANPDILFRGIPRGPTRAYTLKTLKAVKPERVVVPCCGSFSLAVVSIAAGLKPEQIMCGDISLYSTAIAQMARLACEALDSQLEEPAAEIA